MEVIITPQAKKQIKKLPKIIQITVVEKLNKIEAGFIVGVEKLTGYKGLFRMRVGSYRIVYRILAGKSYVVLVGHRREVYRLLDRIYK